jgi:Rrf2 family protein
MALNCRFGLAVHVLAAIATNGKRLSSAELAKTMGTNPVVVRRLLADLQRAGLVENRKGTLGGSELARPPRQITLDQVYRAVDEYDIFHIPTPADRKCPTVCKAQEILGEILDRSERAMEKELRRTRLSDLIPQAT